MKVVAMTNINPRDILCFSDIMDNLSELKEMDIVPMHQIE